MSRSVVIDLFCGKERNAKLKKADFIEATKIKLDREFSNSEYMQVTVQSSLMIFYAFDRNTDTAQGTS